MEKCRVLELIGGSLTDGGAETLVKDYVLNIDKSRFETAVFVDWKIPETANTRILTDNGQLIYTSYPRYSLFWRGINKFFRKSFLVRGIRKAIKDFNPDVIHVHLDALSYICNLKSDIRGRKLFYTCHSTVEAMLEENEKEFHAAQDLVKNNGLRFIALHQQMADELNQKFGVTDTAIVNNGINLERFKSVDESRDEIRSDLGVPIDSFVVGHVGRFSEEKNHKMIIEIFKKVKERQKKAFLLLVGDGQLRTDIEEKLKEYELGNSTLILSHRTDIPRLLKAMDVFLLPSLYEGFPVSLIEALCAGKRCVVSKNVPEEAFVSDLVIPIDISESIDNWVDAVLDGKRRSSYQNRLDEYDIKTTVRRLEKIYLGEIQ